MLLIPVPRRVSSVQDKRKKGKKTGKEEEKKGIIKEKWEERKGKRCKEESN